MATNTKAKVWIKRNEQVKAEKVNVDFSEIQDLDDLKGLVFGETEKGLYASYFNDTELEPDASIPTDTTAQKPVIFKKESATLPDAISQKEQLADSSSTVAISCPSESTATSSPSESTATSSPSESTATSSPSETVATRLIQNAKIIKNEGNGYPTIYKVAFHEQIINRKYSLRKCHIGNKVPIKGCHPPEKTIMILGATGAGKSTMINAFVNYYYGVQWNDSFRLKLITEEDEGVQGMAKSQAKSQTRWITAYALHNELDCAVPYTLTLIDTPGYGDSDGIVRDAEITSQIRELFSTANGIDHIDAIGFVVQSSLVRLTPTQKYIFDSILSLFGKNIAPNILLIITFCDGQEPPVLAAIKEGDVPYGDYFKFNNSSLFAKNKLSGTDADANFDAMFWKLGYSSLKNFFNKFQNFNPASLFLTKETLKERHRLETTVQGIQPQVQDGLSKLETLRQEAGILNRHANAIKDNQSFEYCVDVPKHRQVKLQTGTYVTNCLKCNATCHYPCEIPNDKDKRDCAAMNGDNCTVCAGKCHWEQHKNNDFRYETYIVKEKRTYADMVKRYKDAQDEYGKKTDVFQSLMNDFQNTQFAVLTLIAEARSAVARIEQIALKANPLSVVSYIELMIESEKQEHRPGCTERIKHLEIVKQQAQLIQDLKDDNYDPLGTVFYTLDEFKDIQMPNNSRKNAGFLAKIKRIFKF